MNGEALDLLLKAEERREAKAAEAAYVKSFAQMAPKLPVITEYGEIRYGGELISTYALWEDINEAIRPILHRFGFAMSFRVDQNEGEVIGVTAVLSHTEGHSTSTTIKLAPDASGEKNSVQAVGSSVSYGKRYAATALLNLTTRGEDDDAAETGSFVTPHQALRIESALKLARADTERFLRFFKVERIHRIPADRFEEALASIACKVHVQRGRAIQ